MWHVLKAELAYVRPWLLGGLGIATGVGLLLTLIFTFGTDDSTDPWVASGLRGMFLLMAPLIVTFIMQGYRSEERRLRLLMAGPLTPRQVVLVSVLLTLTLLGIGVGLTLSLMLIEAALRGTFDFQAIHIATMTGGVMFAVGQMVALAQESTAARQQGRRAAAWAGWLTFVAAVLVYTGSQALAIVTETTVTRPMLHATNGAIAAVAMLGSVLLFERRTDFTR